MCMSRWSRSFIVSVYCWYVDNVFCTLNTGSDISCMEKRSPGLLNNIHKCMSVLLKLYALSLISSTPCK